MKNESQSPQSEMGTLLNQGDKVWDCQMRPRAGVVVGFVWESNSEGRWPAMRVHFESMEMTLSYYEADLNDGTITPIPPKLRGQQRLFL